MTYSSSSTVSRQCCHTSLQQVTTIMPLPELVCAADGAPSPACQRGSTGRCARLLALGWEDRSASRSVRRVNIYQAREGLWKFEGNFNEHRASGCICESFLSVLPP